MNLPNPKELKRLADACRKSGITHFKSGDIEFTLGDKPSKSLKSNKISTKSTVAADSSQLKTALDKFTTDSLSEEELLFWSSGGEIGHTDRDTE